MTFRTRFLTAAAALSIAALTVPASAQTNLDRGNIIRSLEGVEEAAQQIDAQEVIAEVRRRVQTNIPANQGLPIFDRLNRLPQLTLEIVFDNNRSTIRPQSYVALGRIADALHHPLLAQHSFIVVGHTDSNGSRQSNLDLSQRRAEAIVEALATTFDISASRLIPVGMGEEQLRDPSRPTDQVNRRVQLITVGKTH